MLLIITYFSSKERAPPRGRQLEQDDEIDEYTDSQKREMFIKQLVQILGDDGSVEMETLGEVFSLYEVTVDKFESVF